MHYTCCPAPKHPQYAPHQWNKLACGQKSSMLSLPLSSLPILDKKITRRIQSINGTFLYYARTVKPTMLPAIYDFFSQQAQLTSDTIDTYNMITDYAHTYPNTIICCHAGNMFLHIDSYATYLVQPKSRSRGAGYFYPRNTPTSLTTTPSPKSNSPILTECTTLKRVMSSATEAEIRAIHHNGKYVVPICITLNELGNTQDPAPLKTDSNTSAGFLKSAIIQKKSKS